MAFLFSISAVCSASGFSSIAPSYLIATRVPLSISQPTFNLYSAGWQPKVGQPCRGTVGEGACELMTEEFGGSSWPQLFTSWNVIGDTTDTLIAPNGTRLCALHHSSHPSVYMNVNGSMRYQREAFWWTLYKCSPWKVLWTIRGKQLSTGPTMGCQVLKTFYKENVPRTKNLSDFCSNIFSSFLIVLIFLARRCW